ncbi:MAG: hypothetical protein M1828_006469 [Chrysothrix sp. TS-e1954]|nr:MAG: hypothetical protein M1828_006469 [Chrysothrix sp. TS-e1954]
MRARWTLTVFASIVSLASSTPLSLADTELLNDHNSTVAKRCANPCGYWGQLCCGEGQTCFTDSNDEAQCGSGSAQVTTAPSGSGHWQYYTSTWVETDLITKTSVYSSYVPTVAGPTSIPATQTAAAASCNWAQGESSCGNICCPSDSYCQVSGQCAPAASSQSVSPAVRPTSSGNTVVIQTSFSTTTTVPFQTPIATGQAASTLTPVASESSGGGGLSGGAIAGIVIGVIAAIILLLLILLCCCFKAGWDALLAVFGLGPRRRRRVVEEKEYRHHSGGGASRRGGDNRTWYGDRPGRIDQIEKRDKKKSGIGGWETAAAGLGAFAIALGLKKRSDDKKASKRRDERSDYTASSDSYSYSYSDALLGDESTQATATLRLPQSHTVAIMPPLPRPTSLHRASRPLLLRYKLSNRSTPSITVRPLTSSAPRRSGDSHESHLESPGQWLWGVPPGTKYEKEGWETVTYWGLCGTLGLSVVAYAFKPDTSIETWALEEAKRRLQAEGTLPEEDLESHESFTPTKK